MKSRSLLSLGIAGAMLFVAACDNATPPSAPEAPDAPDAPAVTQGVYPNTPPTQVTPPAVPGSPTVSDVHVERLIVCKYGTDASFDYTWTDNDDGTNGGDSFSLSAGDCVEVLAADGLGASFTVTEDLTSLPTGGQLDQVVITTNNDGVLSQSTIAGPSASGSVSGLPLVGVLVEYFNSVTPPGGGEGCTPGYWKNHAGIYSHSRGGQRKPSAWETYLPTDLYDTVFGVTSSFGGSFRLIDALEEGGGDEDALARHAVSALLNAAHSDVSYDLSTGDVILLVQGAYASGDFQGAKNTLAAYNEQGCPLGNGN